MQRNMTTVISTLLIIMLSTAMAFAQEPYNGTDAMQAGKGAPGQMPPAPGSNASNPHTRGDLMRQNLMQQLNLDKATAAKLTGEIKVVMEKRRKIRISLSQHINKLKMEMKAESPNDKTLKTILEDIETSNESLIQLRQEEVSIFKKYLSIRQQAQMVITQNERMQQRGKRPMMRPGGNGGHGGPSQMMPGGGGHGGQYQKMPGSGPSTGGGAPRPGPSQKQAQ